MLAGRTQRGDMRNGGEVFSRLNFIVILLVLVLLLEVKTANGIDYENEDEDENSHQRIRQQLGHVAGPDGGEMLDLMTATGAGSAHHGSKGLAMNFLG